MIIARLGVIAGWLGSGKRAANARPENMVRVLRSGVCQRGLSGAKTLEPRRNLVASLSCLRILQP